MILYRQKIYSDDMSRDIVKEFLGTLSGFIHKAKVLHWAASGKDIHEYLDELWEEIYKFQDTIAEGYMGIMGKLDTDIVFLPAESDNPWEFIREVESKTVDFYNLLPSDPRYKGLSGEIESFIQGIEKYKYLFSLCQKEFSIDTTDVLAGAGTAAGLGLATDSLINSRDLKGRKAKLDKMVEGAAAEKEAATAELKKLGNYRKKEKELLSEIKKLPASGKGKEREKEILSEIGKLTPGKEINEIANRAPELRATAERSGKFLNKTSKELAGKIEKASKKNKRRGLIGLGIGAVSVGTGTALKLANRSKENSSYSDDSRNFSEAPVEGEEIKSAPAPAATTTININTSASPVKKAPVKRKPAPVAKEKTPAELSQDDAKAVVADVENQANSPKMTSIKTGDFRMRERYSRSMRGSFPGSMPPIKGLPELLKGGK